MKYTVDVRVLGGWSLHSEHDSYRDAVDQADMVNGVVMVNGTHPDKQAWQWAKDNQGFTGNFEEWQSQDDDERDEYEQGAAGIPTA